MPCSCNVDGVQYYGGRRQLMGCVGVVVIQGVDGCMSVCSAGCICAGVAWHGGGSLGSVPGGYVGMRCLCNVDGVQYCN